MSQPMNLQTAVNILRNPLGWEKEDRKAARLFAAAELERLHGIEPPTAERLPDERDRLSLHQLNSSGCNPYSLRRLAEGLWKPGPICESFYYHANAWERDVRAAASLAPSMRSEP